MVNETYQFLQQWPNAVIDSFFISNDPNKVAIMYSKHIYHTCELRMYVVIGASLSEPHHVRSTVKFVFLLACLYVCMYVCMLVTALYG